MSRNRWSLATNVGATGRARSVGGAALAFARERKSEVLVGTRASVSCVDLDSAASDKSAVTLKGSHRHEVVSIAFHPNGAQCVTVSVDSVTLWNVSDWSRVQSMGAGAGVVTAAYTPSGSTLLVAFRDDTILGWSTSTMERTVTLSLSELGSAGATITCMSVSPDGRLLLTGTVGRDLLLWDLEHECLLRVVEMPATCSSIVQTEFIRGFSSGEGDAASDGGSGLGDFAAAVLGDDGEILIVRPTATVVRVLLRVSKPRSRAVLSFAVEPKGRYLASCVSDGTMLIHDLSVARKYKETVRAARREMG